MTHFALWAALMLLLALWLVLPVGLFVRRRRNASHVALFALLILAPLAGCGDDAQVLVTPDTLPTASPSPSPTPTPDPCATADVLVQAKLGGGPIYAWVPGQVPTLSADPLDSGGQVLDGSCPGVQVVGWDRVGSATCNFQGSLNRRSIRYVCDTVGETQVDATINQFKGAARFSIIGGDEALRLEAAGLDWQRMRPVELRHAVAGLARR